MIDGGSEASFDDGVRYGLRIEGAFVLDGDGRNAVFDHVYVHAGDARNFADFFTHAHGAVVAGEAGCFDGGGCHDVPSDFLELQNLWIRRPRVSCASCGILRRLPL